VILKISATVVKMMRKIIINNYFAEPDAYIGAHRGRSLRPPSRF